MLPSCLGRRLFLFLSLSSLSSLSSFLPFLLLLLYNFANCQSVIRLLVSYRHRHSFLVILDKQNTYLKPNQGMCPPDFPFYLHPRHRLTDPSSWGSLETHLSISPVGPCGFALEKSSARLSSVFFVCTGKQSHIPRIYYPARLFSGLCMALRLYPLTPPLASPLFDPLLVVFLTLVCLCWGHVAEDWLHCTGSVDS